MEYHNIPMNEHKIGYVHDLVNLIDKSIPNFNYGWLEIGRYMVEDKSRWLSNLNPLLECIGTGHYTILKSLNYIRIAKCISESYLNDPEQRFKNIFFHFGVITDCTNQIARSIVLIESKLKIRSFVEKRFTEEEIMSTVEKRIGKDYNSRYDKLVKYGTPISVEIQPERDVYLKTLDSTNQYIGDYRIFRQAIQTYRNTYIHNPTIDVFVYNGKECVFNTKARKTQISLNDFRFLGQLDGLDEDDFIHPQDLINNNFRQLLIALNSMWDLFGREINKINSDKSLDEILFLQKD